MRPRLARVSAVSAAENTADTASNARISGAAARIASLKLILSRAFGDKEAERRAGVDALGDERLADAARQDEGQRPALGLLVLRHVRHQRRGAERAGGDVGKTRRQAGRGDRPG